MKRFQTTLFTVLLFFLSFTASSQIFSRSDLNKALSELENTKGEDLLESTLEVAQGYMSFQLDSAKMYAKKGAVLAVRYEREYEKQKCLYLLIKVKYYQIGLYENILDDLEYKANWFKKSRKVLPERLINARTSG